MHHPAVLKVCVSPHTNRKTTEQVQLTVSNKQSLREMDRPYSRQPKYWTPSDRSLNQGQVSSSDLQHVTTWPLHTITPILMTVTM